MTQEPQARSGGRGPAIWALITGLAVGFAVGRETGGGKGGGSDDGPASDSKPQAAAAGTGAKPSKVYTRQSDFPPGWLKEADLAAVAGLSFDGLNDRQKTTALQSLNERNCECGCNMGSLATCAKKDPNCPRSPVLARLAIEKAKEGKSLSDVLDALDAKQKELGVAGPKPAAEAQAPKGPKKIEIADNMPRKGPKAAKATIVEWSDFQ